jgi:predicted DNA-binding transcriptional regulator AlpA
VLQHRRGRLIYDLWLSLVAYSDGSAGGSTLGAMCPNVATEDLIDAHGVARILGLSLSQTVSTYQRRYRDMPKPVVDLGQGRPKLWLRSEMERWAAELAESGRTRPRRRVVR